jgi:hypothetical protein
MKDIMILLKRKICFSFFIIIILIAFSGALGWILTQQFEECKKVMETVHSFKEAELQRRSEEKNFLLRGYSQQRLQAWQNAKMEFDQRFGELIGLKVLTESDINGIKTNNTEMSGVYNRFFEDIQSAKLSENKIAYYDAQFKISGQRTSEIIKNILAREHEEQIKNSSRTNFLIIIFLIVFSIAATFLAINVIKNLC